MLSLVVMMMMMKVGVLRSFLFVRKRWFRASFVGVVERD
jgi:hypothetical protein